MDHPGTAADTAAKIDDAETALLALLDRVRSGEATGWAGVELMSDGSGRWHVHGSACTDRWRTAGALVELVHGVQHAPKE